MAIVSIATPRYVGLKVTREEYLDLDDDGFKYDVINGEMTMAPGAEFEHGEWATEFIFQVRYYLEKQPIAKIVSEIDVLLPDGGDPLRPDVTIILNENLRMVKKHIHGAPDIVCEILSPSTRDRDLGEKADRYLKAGVKEYFILDPETGTSQVWRNRGGKWDKVSGNALNSEVLPGFVLKSAIR
jgi:Uma2 family endonuclease